MLRTLPILALGVLLLASALALETQLRIDAALAGIESSRTITDPSARERSLRRVGEGLERSWAKPLAWNAHANEAQSAIYALRFEAREDPRLLAQSAIAAGAALDRSPLLPQSWIRSAQLSLLGTPGAPCTALQCLEMSWRIAPILDPQSDCLRLQLAHAAGMETALLQQRVMSFASTDAPARTLMTCLDFMTPEERFNAVVRARA